jgi:glycosyltransferase involved in cell wall biosynthesis
MLARPNSFTPEKHFITPVYNKSLLRYALPKISVAILAGARAAMKTSCIINNYNYGHFCIEAIRSALVQTIPFDEIIIIDDGSTDESVVKLSKLFAAEPRVKIITQKNGGMLSTHNRGYLESTGDVLFFLDADDLYVPERVQTVLEIMQRDSQIGLVFSPFIAFGKTSGTMYTRKSRSARIRRLPEGEPLPEHDLDFGSVFNDVYYHRNWIGTPTSGLSIRRRVLDMFMPIDLETAWRRRSDDCLIYGSALTGTHFYYHAKPLALYRLHGNNDWFGRKETPAERLAHEKNLNGLFTYLAKKLELPDRTDPKLLAGLAEEYSSRSVPIRDWRRLSRRLRQMGFSQREALAWRAKLLMACLRGKTFPLRHAA